MTHHPQPDEGRRLPRLGITPTELERWLTGTPALTARQLQDLRQQLGLTQLGLARVLGVSESAVSLWEAGKRKPRGPAHRLLTLLAELATQV
jgi:DNA-binding transcriptional regulator YiaG